MAILVLEKSIAFFWLLDCLKWSYAIDQIMVDLTLSMSLSMVLFSDELNL